MGEEEKKSEEKKPEEAKKPVLEEKKKEEETKKPASEEKTDQKSNNGETPKEEKDKEKAPPPQPQEILLKVYMHCEGCARKIRKCLKGFQGVEDVITDCKTSKVVVKGEKADPIKVLERVQRKSHRQVELLSPIPKPPSQDIKPKPEDDKEKPKPEEKKPEPLIVTVVLKVYMHCEACAQEIKKRILKMKGVESAEPDLKSSQVTVKGALDPNKLVEYVYKRTGKQAVIVKPDIIINEDNNNNNNNNKEGKKDEKKSGDQEGDTKKSSGGSDEAINNPEENKSNKKEDQSEQQKQNNDDNNNKEFSVTEDNKVVEIKRNEFNYYYPQPYAMEMYPNNSYPPQIFSDENPNACSIM